MSDINTFWNSSIIGCSCGPDLPICQNNALALDYRQGGRGYVYYDPNILSLLSSIGGTNVAAAWFLSHEVGHNIQQEFGLSSQLSVARELSADCYAGYFLGWLKCIGRIGDADITGTLRAACSAQDPAGTPWFAQGAHGTCEQRVSSVSTGISRYEQGIAPLNACTF